MINVFGRPNNYNEVQGLMANWDGKNLEEIVSGLESNHCVVKNYLSNNNNEFVKFYDSLIKSIKCGSLEKLGEVDLEGPILSLFSNNNTIYAGCYAGKLHVIKDGVLSQESHNLLKRLDNLMPPEIRNPLLKYVGF